MSIDLVLDEREKLGPVRDQGPFSICLSCATSAAHDHILEEAAPLSAEYLHYFATDGDWRSGVGMDQVREVLRTEGQPEARSCEELSPSRADVWEPPRKAEVYTRETDTLETARAAIQRTLAEGRLPVLGVEITDSFCKAQAPWILSDGEPVAQHAILAVGLGRAEGEELVLIRNSWGPGWGNGGHAWLTNEYLEEHLQEMILLSQEA